MKPGWLRNLAFCRSKSLMVGSVSSSPKGIAILVTWPGPAPSRPTPPGRPVKDGTDAGHGARREVVEWLHLRQEPQADQDRHGRDREPAGEPDHRRVVGFLPAQPGQGCDAASVDEDAREH